MNDEHKWEPIEVTAIPTPATDRRAMLEGLRDLDAGEITLEWTPPVELCFVCSAELPTGVELPKIETRDEPRRLLGHLCMACTAKHVPQLLNGAHGHPNCT